MYTVKQEHIVCFAIADQGLILQNDTFAGVTDLMWGQPSVGLEMDGIQIEQAH